MSEFADRARFRRRVVTLAAVVAVGSSALVFAPGAGATPVPASTHVGSVQPAHHGRHHPAPASVIPRANSAWAYDTDTPGTWVSTIKDYNAHATRGHALTQVYSYATDMEMYCPGNDGTKCSASDLISVYDAAAKARTAAYANAFKSSAHGRDNEFTLSPIIDGRTDANGYLQGFNELSPTLAAGFADKVASQVCADDNIDGIQFDLEPFDVSSVNGQYWFYLQLAKDFAGRHAGAPTGDPYGCVNAAHPRGRFWSVFTFAKSIQPGTTSASNVRTIMRAYGNGYLMDSLYDLSSAPAGTLNGIGDYRGEVLREALQTRVWANLLGIDYGYGIPASASAHEFTTCTETPGTTMSCVPDRTGAKGYPMLDYTSAAVFAINLVGAPRDRRFVGTAIWDFGASVSWNGLDFSPSPAPADVLRYLDTRLPGALRR